MYVYFVLNLELEFNNASAVLPLRGSIFVKEYLKET